MVKVVGKKVYVLGTFRSAGPTSVSGAAEWTGAGWVPMGSGVPLWRQYQLASAATDGHDLYVSTSGFGATEFLQRWDGTAWNPVGEAGPGGPAVAISGADIYAVGNFTQGYGVAKLEGSHWTGLGGAFRSAAGLPTFINALAVNGADVYAAGFFATVEANAIEQVARWEIGRAHV